MASGAEAHVARGLSARLKPRPSRKHDVTSHENDVTFNQHAVPFHEHDVTL
jgi:hypothetical protein